MMSGNDEKARELFRAHLEEEAFIVVVLLQWHKIPY